MIDKLGRTINYMRISVTDRCNLRCVYCMPDGVRLVRHCDMLSYEEILRLCGIAVSLGIDRFKITGGEPLVRRGCTGFIARLKAMPGVRQVTLTTNGLLLDRHLDDLCAAGIDGVNISLDTLEAGQYRALTGFTGEIPGLKAVVADCVSRGLRTKINTVLLAQTADGIPQMAALAENMDVDVRFIELMPIGPGSTMEGISMEEALERLKAFRTGLHPVDERRGNGPARYFHAEGLRGRIGFISAMSGQFCDGCNRVRLTGTGELKPCLCYEAGTSLRALLRGGATDRELVQVMGACIHSKPEAHCFLSPEDMTEEDTMNRIGG